MINAFGGTDPGPVRKINEDTFFSDPALQLFIVADGLGGHAAGEVASKLAVETISGFVRRIDEEGELSWPYGIEPTLSFGGNLLRTAVHLANRRVFRAAEREDDYTGMATTVVAALISGSRLAVASAGDSRLYLFAGGTLSQLTRDDTWAATILATEEDPGRGALSPRLVRHVLTNVVGAREQGDVHLHEHDLHGGETILMCSDGLHGVVDDDAIARTLAAGGTPAEIVPRLIDAALTGGAKDNVTVLLARYEAQ
ncbi:MAG: protein phosphatase 2C domain-containing protein [Vicinamibacterales bacterium]